MHLGRIGTEYPDIGLVRLPDICGHNWIMNLKSGRMLDNTGKYPVGEAPFIRLNIRLDIRTEF